MLPEYEMAVYVNPSANKAAINKAESLRGETIYRDSIPFQEEPLKTQPKKIISIGGERTNRTVIAEVYRGKEPRMIAISEGGRHNVVFHFLEKTGRMMTLDEFRQANPNSIPDKFLYHPGQATDKNGHTEIFNNHIGWGTYPEMVGSFEQGLQFLPARYRSNAARFGAAVPAALHPGKRLKVYTIVDNIGGSGKLQQDLFGKDLTKAEIVGIYFLQWLRLAGTTALWQFNKSPPKFILRTSRGTIFDDNIRSRNIWIDGDTLKNPLRGSIDIRRAEMPIYLVGLAG